MIKKYCLTYEYPGVCWTYYTSNPKVFFECSPSYEMAPVPIKGIVELTFKCWVNKDELCN